MRKKFKCLIIIYLLILSILIVYWDVDLKANNLDNDENNTSTSRSIKYSRAAAFDWGEIEVISEPTLGNNFNTGVSSVPSIAVENDKIFMVWMDRTNYNNAGNDLDIFYRYFDSSKWSEIQVISEPIQNQNLNIEDSWDPKIAVENGKIYVVWYDNNNTNGAGSDDDIFFRCNLTGSGWEDLQVISEPILGKNLNIQYSLDPEIAVENGKIYVVWEDSNNTNGAGTDFDVLYRSNLTGFSWEGIQVISEPVQGQNFNKDFSELPSIAVENSKIYVVWWDNNDTNYAGIDDDIFFRCNLTGYNWEPIQVISEPVPGNNFNTGVSNEPAVAVDNGKIYVVWQDNNDTNDAGTDWDIFYRCNLTNASWEDIQVISEPVLSRDLNIQNSMIPEIVVEYSKIYVVWKDYNDTNNAGLDADIFYKCNLTSLYWEPVQIISEPRVDCDININISGVPDIAVNHGKNHIVWHDENNTNGTGTDYDIFYRHISLPLVLSHPTVTPVSGNTSILFNFTVIYFQFDNKSPTKITVIIDDTEYLMSEVDLWDINYVDGKKYFFNIRNLDIGLHNFSFLASDGNKIFSTKRFKNPIVKNTPPKIITDNNLTTFEDEFYEVKYEYLDIDLKNVGQLVNWNFSSNASWLLFDIKTGELSGIPINNDSGKYWVNISISDSIDIDFINFTLTVINVNDAPFIITNNTEIIYEDAIYETYYNAIDVDNPQKDLLWYIKTNASWLNFDSITGKLFGTPTNDDVGEYWVNISVDDGEYIDYSNFTLEVININDPPRIITKDNTTAFEDEFYEVIYKVEDVDNEYSKLSWNINTNAKWLNYDDLTASINGTPTNDDVDEYWVNVSVSDNEYLDYTNFTLIVINTNDPPDIIIKDVTNTTVGELFSVNYEANDIDPPPVFLEWSLKSNTSGWLSIDPLTGWLTGTPTDNDVGIYWMNISVTDGEGGWDHHNFTLQIIKLKQKQNIKPILTNPVMTPATGEIKTKFSFFIHYYDPDNDAPVFIQLILDNAIYNMQLIPTENVSNGTYTTSVYLTLGEHDYYFTASDGIQTVRTDNSTTSFISKESKTTQESTFIYWLILIIILIIIFSLLFVIFYKKRKAEKIQVVKAELLKVAPKHIAMAGELVGAKAIEQLPQKPVIIDQLPEPEAKALPVSTEKADSKPMKFFGTSPVQPQFQLPQTTLSKEQKLGLLQERFLRSEVDLETYKKLRAEIEGIHDEDIYDIDK